MTVAVYPSSTVAPRLDAPVNRIDHFHVGGGCRTAECSLPARHMALQSVASGDGFGHRHAASFDAFFEKQAKAWNIPARTPRGCARWSTPTIEDVAATCRRPGRNPDGERHSFDIEVTLRYTGNLPALPDARPRKHMVEEQSFVSGPSGYLSGLHADRIERSAKGEQCEIRVLFRRENLRRTPRPAILKTDILLACRRTCGIFVSGFRRGAVLTWEIILVGIVLYGAPTKAASARNSQADPVDLVLSLSKDVELGLNHRVNWSML